MKKVRLRSNIRLNGAFYGRDSVLDVTEKEATHLASLGLAEILIIQKPYEAPEAVVKVEKEEVKQPEVVEKPKAKAKKAVKK